MKKILSVILSVFIVLTIFTGCTNSTNTGKKDNSKEYAFTVAEGKQIYFAESNLQYCPKTKTWRFADNAYDYVGAANSNIDENYEGYIDLFAWGATGVDGAMAPYSTDDDNTKYGNGHNSIAGTNGDFGKAVEEQLGAQWRMFTNEEIHYVLMKRDNAEKLFGYGTIDGIRGLFILPDDWQCIDGIDFKPSVEMGFENQYDWYYTIGDKENYTYNHFTKADWDEMKEAGAVFLPALGFRAGTDCYHTDTSGHYWTSSNYGEEFANCLCLFEKDLFLEGNFDRSYGLGIRLVKND